MELFFNFNITMAIVVACMALIDIIYNVSKQHSLFGAIGGLLSIVTLFCCIVYGLLLLWISL
jgi:hypothetical protein